MKRPAPAALLALLLCGCASDPAQIQLRAPLQHLSGPEEHYIVAGVDNPPLPPPGHAGSTPRGYDLLDAYGPSPRARQTLLALEKEYGLHEVTAWPIVPLRMHCAVLEVPAGADRAALLAALARDQRVRLAQPLQAFSTRTEIYNDPYVDLQRGFQQMDVADAHTWSRGAGVRIAIIDTGADTAHPDLRASIARAVNFVDADPAQFRQDRHGTEVAGVIAAVANNRQGIVGIAPGAQLLIFKACWQLQAGADPARCNTFTVAQALVAALDTHAQVVNLSLVGPADPLLHELITEGSRRGIVFVGAHSAATPETGNALLRNSAVIEVASAGDGVAGEAALYAPGREILTLLPGGHYDFASGSSLATAHVTGAVALLLAINPHLTPGAVYRLLRDATRQLATDAGGYETVNACAAVVALDGRGACPRAAPSGSRVVNAAAGAETLR